MLQSGCSAGGRAVVPPHAHTPPLRYSRGCQVFARTRSPHPQLLLLLLLLVQVQERALAPHKLPHLARCRAWRGGRRGRANAAGAILLQRERLPLGTLAFLLLLLLHQGVRRERGELVG